MKNIIIILNYNDFETTQKYIEQIINYKSIDKMIVVDNASPDLSFEKLKGYASEKIDVIYNPKNEGYAKGNNFGINYVNSKYTAENIIISNPDIIVSDESINEMTKFLDNNSEYASVTGLIRNLNDDIVKNYAWKQPSYLDIMFSSSLVLNKIYNTLNPEYMFYKKPTVLQGHKDVEVLSGCFFMIRNDVLKEIKNFDESTFLYHEENLLFKKINNLGFKNAVLLPEKIVHFEGISVAKNYGSYLKKARFMHDSATIYLTKALNISPLQLKIFNIIFKLGTIEKYFYIKYIKSRSNKNEK
ncbi:glycosyltransferase [Macrococcus capreoli]|uniref:glycosyltransferase n=1 Tax=Macrococcus capreoli TaxID=2982690 RepID=UPI0021D5AE01|nr:glycosyltransferase [Macrococcus sp. TMW 2.2395]MCU7557542.1 glycosyltransferase [Macrococcus sp. TMW 2.2395]